MLLELNRLCRHWEQFESTLKKERGALRSLVRAAHAAQLSGSRDTSRKYFRELLRFGATPTSLQDPNSTEAERAILRK